MKRAILAVALAVLATGWGRADETALAVVKKGIEAHGGEESLKKAKGGDYKVEGEVTIGAEKGKFTSSTSYALPDKFRVSMESAVGGKKATQVVVINGDKVKAMGDGKAQELKPEVKAAFLQLAAMQEVSLLYPLLDDKKFTLKAEKDEKVEDKDAAVVLVSRKGMTDVRLFFDKKTGEMVRFVYKGLDAYGEQTTTEVTNAEFKKFDGVLQPTLQKMKQANREYMTLRVTEARLLEKPDLKAYAID
ncbi:MAG: hypothetical protein MUF18_06060 [Fimbriiglobus sp.]|jgi:outer membrane lipoprotein-sorting protein|nr:hypothetical protein [Fimbriiglobus sp.]